MTRTTNQIIEEIIAREGERYTNIPNDRGGPTKYGITLATLRAWRNNPIVDAYQVQILTKDEAKRIYYDRYVMRPGFFLILHMSELIGLELIDSGVNCGITRASSWLQVALNAFNRSYRVPADYAELTIDGMVGPATRDALSRFMALRGKARAERVIFRAMNCQQGAHYLKLGISDIRQEEFMLGWFDNRIA